MHSLLFLYTRSQRPKTTPNQQNKQYTSLFYTLWAIIWNVWRISEPKNVDSKVGNNCIRTAIILNYRKLSSCVKLIFVFQFNKVRAKLHYISYLYHVFSIMTILLWSSLILEAIYQLLLKVASSCFVFYTFEYLYIIYIYF